MVADNCSPARLYLVRHGQASLGSDDYDRLSELGHLQSQALGERLRAELSEDRLKPWRGTLKRHRQTLSRCALSVEPVIDPALNEYTVDGLMRSAVGQAERLGLVPPDDAAFAEPAAYLATFLAWFPEVLAAWQSARLDCEHNGSWRAFHQRVLSPVASWQLQLAAGDSPVVVTSAGVISTLIAALLEKDLARQRELNLSLYNASISTLEWHPAAGWRPGILNCVQHLDGRLTHTLA
ncbi:MAG: histidine phosphatase family protein [Wenzhouxiangella sp.]|nr:histidine phosphatase family protein [Wenzhouxiangella sp.]